MEGWCWFSRRYLEGPIVEHIIRIRYHGGELQLYTDLQKGHGDGRRDPNLHVRWQGVNIEVHIPGQYVMRTS